MKPETKYFYYWADYIRRLFHVNVPMYPLDHKRHLPVEEGQEILGCCHRYPEGYVITVDEPYIGLCYYGRMTDYSPYNDDKLIETICHEIAHLFVWEHSDNHTELTNTLYNVVKKQLRGV